MTPLLITPGVGHHAEGASAFGPVGLHGCGECADVVATTGVGGDETQADVAEAEELRGLVLATVGFGARVHAEPCGSGAGKGALAHIVVLPDHTPELTTPHTLTRRADKGVDAVVPAIAVCWLL